ncbi:MAG: tetratricopeptide repeat protein [Candidatus Aureabacteria bacterium]|nr:tetratricopeptide repeat protein [Candidatus Auribacterota bacterium]
MKKIIILLILAGISVWGCKFFQEQKKLSLFKQDYKKINDCLAQHNYKEGIESGKKLVDYATKTFGEMHPCTAQANNRLGRAYKMKWKIGNGSITDRDLAIKYLKKALGILDAIPSAGTLMNERGNYADDLASVY